MIVEMAPAKINLALHVRARRADGYHDIETLFAFVEDGDEIQVALAEADRFVITGPYAAVLGSEGDNLVTRARDRFRDRFGLAPMAISLDKKLPVASGIGGGSADAAATLRALAKLGGIAPDDAALYEIADTLGSDVPACVFGRTARGVGRGERLEAIDGLAPLPALLVNPGIAVSTAAVFRAWDQQDRGALALGTPLDAARSGRNDLEAPARALAPAIDTVLGALDAPGAELVRMSGSGATCFALFADSGARDDAACAIAASHPEWWTLATRLRA